MGLLEEPSRETGTDCAPRPARESSLALWRKADAYYFCNIARVKRIWQVWPPSLLSRHAMPAHDQAHICARLICGPYYVAHSSHDVSSARRTTEGAFMTIAG